jgi:hypothetical protein
MSTTTLRPGLLVSLHTSIHGGVRYTRVDLDANAPADDGPATVEKWETTKVIDDPQEYERAVKVRGKCSSLIRGCCAHSAFGLLCAVAEEEKLDAAFRDAATLADTFNRQARTVRIGVYMLKGRIAESDTEAARAIASEIRGLLDAMKAGIAEVDVSKIRDAANKAKRIGGMLNGSVSESVNAAIQEARDAARDIVKRVANGADKATIILTDYKLKELDSARFSFLDLDAPSTSVIVDLPPRALDMDEGNEDSHSCEQAIEYAASGREVEV